MNMSDEVLNANTILSSLNNAFPNEIQDTQIQSEKRVIVRIKAESIAEVSKYLLDSLKFDHLACVCGVDYRDHLDAVYHIESYEHPVVLTLKASVPTDNAEIESVTSIWWNANWYERETYELMGIKFNNHPNLVPLILTEEMLGEYPLRKDYENFPDTNVRNPVFVKEKESW